jgi:predicted phosphodiesterase
MSDLHLEFDPNIIINNDQNCDVLILAGDICVGSYFKKTEASPYYNIAQKTHEFFTNVCQSFENVIYIFGNHEHYRGYIDETKNLIKEELNFPNLHILENEYIDIGDTRFIGSTLWTDMHGGDPLTMEMLRQGMNDFRLIEIKSKTRKYRPADARENHVSSKQYIFNEVQNHDKCVVVSHHSPSRHSIHPRYRNDYHMNGGYHSNLDEIIMDHPSIKLWIHGHTHDSFDYKINDTRIMCNPRGYNNENMHFDRNIVVEI